MIDKKSNKTKLAKTIKSLECMLFKLHLLNVQNKDLYSFFEEDVIDIINQNIDSIQASIDKLIKLKQTRFN